MLPLVTECKKAEFVQCQFWQTEQSTKATPCSHQQQCVATAKAVHNTSLPTFSDMIPTIGTNHYHGGRDGNIIFVMQKKKYNANISTHKKKAR